MAPQPLQFALIMTLDAKGVAQGSREARQEIAATGQAAKSAGGDLGQMTAAMQAEARAANEVRQALTGAAGAEAAYRQAAQRTAANVNIAGVPAARPAPGPARAGGVAGGAGPGSPGGPMPGTSSTEIAALGPAARGAAGGVDALGASLGAARREMVATGTAAGSTAGGLGAMSTALKVEAAAAREVTQALTGAAGAEAAYRQEAMRPIARPRSAPLGSPPVAPVGSPPAGGGGGAGGGSPSRPAPQPAMLGDFRERYNPLYKIGQDYQRTLAEIASAERNLGLTTAEANVYRREAAETAERQMMAMNRMPGVYGAVNGQVRLSANQMLNLSRQGNDVATMWLMGADGMQIFASQAGQVYGALQEGPGGVAGSLKAVWGGLVALATPTNLAIAGFTAVAAAGVYFATRTTEKIKLLNEAMEAHKKALKDVADAYGLAFDKADAFQKVSGGEVLFRERRSRAELELSARAALSRNFDRSLIDQRQEVELVFNPDTGGLDRVSRQIKEISDERYKPFAEEIMRLDEQIARGAGDAISFVDDVSKKANLQPLNKDLESAAKYLIDIATEAAAAQRQLRAMALAVDPITRATQEAFRKEREAMLVPDGRSQRQILDAQRQRQINRIDSLVPRTGFEGSPERADPTAAAREGLRTEIERDYGRGLDEIIRQEDNARRSRQLDIASISARTAAQRAAIAEQRMAIELATVEGDQLGQTERQRRIAAEGLKVYAEAQQEANDALRGALDDLALTGLDGAARELASINQEVAREIDLNPRAAETWRAYGEARRAALAIETRLGLFRPQEEELAEIEAMDAALGKSSAERRAIMTDLKVEQEIRRAGIEAMSQEAEAYRRNAHALAEYRAGVERAGEAWEGFEKTGTDAIDKLVDGLTGLDGKMDIEALLGDVAKDFTKQILDLSIGNPFKNALTGGELPTMGDLGGFEGLWARITGQEVKTAAPTIALAERGSTVDNPLFVSLVGPGMPGLPGSSTGPGGPAPAGAVTRGGPLAPVTAAPVADGLVPVSQMAEYIRQAAAVRGIDPDIALRVARAEGLGEGIWQSNASRNGLREPSYGPFQLLKGGRGTGFGRGLGNAFMDRTGLDPADPRNAYAGVDFALDNAAKSGWGAWYGAAKTGVGRWDGLSGAHALPPSLMPQTAIQEEIQQSAATLVDSAQALAPAASQFTTGMEQVLNGTLLGGVGQVADQFVPGFGNVLQQLIRDVGNVGSFGGGGGISAAAASAISAGASGLFERGGYTGDGQRHRIAGYVHAGEVVWNQDDVKAAGGPKAAEAIRIGIRSGGRGYEHGGVVGGDRPVAGARQAGAGSRSAPAAAPIIQIFDQRRGGDDIEQRESVGPDGERRLEIYVRDKVREEVTGAGTDTNRSLRRGYGVAPGLVNR